MPHVVYEITANVRADLAAEYREKLLATGDAGIAGQGR